MVYGFLFMALAAALWGLAFLAPLDMMDISASDITLGRFLVFGLSSVGILAASRPGYLMHLSRKDWGIVFFLGISGNLLYFFFMTLARRYFSPYSWVGAQPNPSLFCKKGE